MLELNIIIFCFEILLCISLRCTFYYVDRRPSKDGWLLLKEEINLFTESIMKMMTPPLFPPLPPSFSNFLTDFVKNALMSLLRQNKASICENYVILPPNLVFLCQSYVIFCQKALPFVQWKRKCAKLVEDGLPLPGILAMLLPTGREELQ